MKKDKSKKIFIFGLILVILELIFIPILIFSGIKKILPIIFFLVIPLLLTILIYFVGKGMVIDIKKKQQKNSI
ncbi:MAG: hypothetical protein PHQ64_03400 [Bacilli bacterium]|nr:hypothetical protein [Bacilli bacterium]